jgi:large subunit ribosomal protein L21
MMFAVIKAGGKQYRVAPEDVIRIDRVKNEPGDVVAFGEVLLLGGDAPQLGAPTVAGATVAGEVLQHERGDKVIAFKKRRRKNSRRKRGYRHEFSLIRITEILTEGAKPSQTPPPRPKREAKKPETAPADEAAEGATDEAKPAKKKAAAKKPAAKKPAKASTRAASTKAANTKGKKK